MGSQFFFFWSIFRCSNEHWNIHFCMLGGLWIFCHLTSVLYIQQGTFINLHSLDVSFINLNRLSWKWNHIQPCPFLLSPSGLSEVQSPGGFPVCVPELRGGAEELKNTRRRPSRCPQRLLATSPARPHLTHRPYYNLVQCGIHFLLCWTCRLCMSASCLITIVNDLLPNLAHCLIVGFFFFKSAEISGWPSWLTSPLIVHFLNEYDISTC